MLGSELFFLFAEAKQGFPALGEDGLGPLGVNEVGEESLQQTVQLETSVVVLQRKEQPHALPVVSLEQLLG